jgi:hypothetical protein
VTAPITILDRLGYGKLCRPVVNVDLPFLLHLESLLGEKVVRHGPLAVLRDCIYRMDGRKLILRGKDGLRVLGSEGDFPG